MAALLVKQLTLSFLFLFLLVGCSAPRVPRSQEDKTSFVHRGVQYQVLSFESEEVQEIQATPTNFKVPTLEDGISWDRMTFFFQHYYQTTEGLCSHCDSMLLVTPNINFKVSRKYLKEKIAYNIQALPSTESILDLTSIALAAKNLARFVRTGSLSQDYIK